MTGERKRNEIQHESVSNRADRRIHTVPSRPSHSFYPREASQCFLTARAHQDGYDPEKIMVAGEFFLGETLRAERYKIFYVVKESEFRSCQHVEVPK